MRKLLLVTTFVIAGLSQAKNVEPKNDKEDKKTEKKVADSEESKGKSTIQCRQVGMFVWCTQEMLSDTVCWGAGSGTATEEQAMDDSLHNSQLVTEFFCGGQP